MKEKTVRALDFCIEMLEDLKEEIENLKEHQYINVSEITRTRLMIEKKLMKIEKKNKGGN